MTPLSPADFDAICLLVCPHCRGGVRLERREATGEWVHTGGGVRSVMHTICWADGLRRSGYAPDPSQLPTYINLTVGGDGPLEPFNITVSDE